MACVNSKAETKQALIKELRKVAKKLRGTRPTAVNLFWALDRMEKRLEKISIREVSIIKKTILKEALCILEEDRKMCHDIGKNGARLIKNGDIILTHCNAGMLATAGQGTALSILYEAKKQGKRFKVFADDTRPLMQGSRLTMWELMANGIDVTLICDDMAATTIKNKGVTKIIVGADRIASNGDTANKIGTYGLAVLAKHYGIPFYVIAPTSTIDKNTPSGKFIPIEERKREELIFIGSKQTAPINAKVFNPAFDVTPADLISAIITEKGIYAPRKIGRV